MLAVAMGVWGLVGFTWPNRAAAAQTPPLRPPLRTGAEVYMEAVGELRGKRVAVVGNQTSVVANDTGGYTHLVDTLLACGVRVVEIFCPEHGFRGTAAAGAHVSNSTDPATGLPIVSLYGKNKKPTPQQLAGVDIVLFDLQDVGCRFYTYLSTLHYVMEACAEAGLPLVVLDRPNPNGHYVDGPVLDTATCRSFVGLHPVPVVYGMTIGEYATMVNGEHWISGHCDLRVARMWGYRRDSVGYVLPVSPSPNLRTPHAIALYPSLCLFEGTTVSVGRGTDHPFELIGTRHMKAPLDKEGWTYPDDTTLRPAVFTPKGEEPCRGFNLQAVEVLPMFDLRYLQIMYAQTAEGRFFLKSNFFDLLAGTPELRRQLEAGMGEAEIRASWQPGLERFREVRSRYLIYAD